MNYNDDYKGNIMVNFAFRNLWNTRAKVFADIVLGQSPRFYGLFILNNGLAPGIGFDIDYFQLGLSTYVDGTKNNNWDFRNLSTSVFMPMVLNNEMQFKLGFQYEYFRFDQDILAGEDSVYEGEFKHFGQWFTSVDADNRDNANFPTKGGKFELKVKYALPIKEMFTDEASNNFYAFIKFEQNLELFKKMVFKPSLFGGYATQSNTLIHKHLFGLGGQSNFNYVDGFVPFSGLRFVEKFGLYSAVGRLHFEYSLINKLYFTLLGDVGFSEMEWNTISSDAILFGYGGKLSYDSFIGPISFSVMGSNVVKGPLYYLNIGFPIK